MLLLGLLTVLFQVKVKTVGHLDQPGDLGMKRLRALLYFRLQLRAFLAELLFLSEKLGCESLLCSLAHLFVMVSFFSQLVNKLLICLLTLCMATVFELRFQGLDALISELNNHLVPLTGLFHLVQSLLLVLQQTGLASIFEVSLFLS